MYTQAIPLEYLRSLFSYNPDTGLFTRTKARQGKNGHLGAIAGTVNPHGYLMININGSLYAGHRLAWYFMTGTYPAFHLDHKDQNKTNNRFSNLRQANYAINARNMPQRIDNKSGVVGVSWDKRGKWFVRIGTKDGNKFLGYRNCIFEAACLRKSAEIKYNYHKNHGLDTSML